MKSLVRNLRLFAIALPLTGCNLWKKEVAGEKTEEPAEKKDEKHRHAHQGEPRSIRNQTEQATRGGLEMTLKAAGSRQRET